MADNISNAKRLAIGMLFLIMFFYVINPLARESMGIYGIMSAIVLVVYNYVPSQYLLGINSDRKSVLKSVIWASGISAGFFLLTRYVPGLSLGLPVLPNAISDSLRFLIVVLVAPIIEELAFRGALFGYIKSFNPSQRKIWFAIILQAVAFSLFHLGAYVSNFYAYPDIASGLVALSGNVASFVTAFLFALIAGWIVSLNGIKNLLFAIILHLLFNLIIYTSLTVVFA